MPPLFVRSEADLMDDSDDEDSVVTTHDSLPDLLPRDKDDIIDDTDDEDPTAQVNNDEAMIASIHANRVNVIIELISFLHTRETEVLDDWEGNDEEKTDEEGDWTFYNSDSDLDAESIPTVNTIDFFYQRRMDRRVIEMENEAEELRLEALDPYYTMVVMLPHQMTKRSFPLSNWDISMTTTR